MLGLVGQAFAFVSLFVPIAFGKYEQLSIQVFVSGYVSIILIAITLGFSSRYPVLIDEDEMRLAYKLTVFVVGFLTTISLIAGWVMFFFDPKASGIILSGAFLLFFQSLDVIATTLLVRARKSEIVPIKRLIYGLSSLVFTLVFSMYFSFLESLIWASSLSFAIGAGFVFFKVRSNPFLTGHFYQKRHWSVIKQYVLKDIRISSSGIMDNLFVQFPSIAILFLGSLAPAWAVVTRIGGGFSTIGLQLMTPHLEERYSMAFRNRRLVDIKASVKFGRLLSVSLTALTSLSIAISLMALQSELKLSNQILQTSICVGISFWGSVLWQVPKTRVLVLSGEINAKWIWSSSRALLAIIVITVCRFVDILVGLGVIAIAWAVYHELLLRRTVSKFNSEVSWHANS